MAYTRAADGVASKGKTKGKNLGDSGPTQKMQTGAKGSKQSGGGKTNEEMLKLGRGLAKVANQKRG
jgi:hypothetical protein